MRVLAEIGIIVVGVLIALGADAWRQSREEAAMADEYRSALIDDLVADSVLFDVLIDRGWFGVQAQAVDSVWMVLAEPDLEVDPLSLLQWMGAAARVGLGEKSSATFEDLRSSGRLVLLADPELRRALVEYHAFPIVRVQQAYDLVLQTSLLDWSRLIARVLGPRRVRAFVTCTDRIREIEGDGPLESPSVRACVEETGAFDGFDLASRLRSEPEAAQLIPILRMMRQLGREGATLARDQAAELRERLREDVE